MGRFILESDICFTGYLHIQTLKMAKYIYATVLSQSLHMDWPNLQK